MILAQADPIARGGHPASRSDHAHPPVAMMSAAEEAVTAAPIGDGPAKAAYTGPPERRHGANIRVPPFP